MGLKRLDTVALEQDARLDKSDAIDVARQKLFAPKTRPRSRWAIAALAAAVAISLWFAWPSIQREPLTFDVDGRTHTQTWVGADGEEKAVRFSDGSNLVLRTGARARVTVLDERGAELALEAGGAAMEVVAAEDARWIVVAGPYRVRITGTRFDVSWTPGSRRFKVVMHEGRVEIAGPQIDGFHVVLAGQTFERQSTPTAIPTAQPSSKPKASASVPQDASANVPEPSSTTAVVAPAPSVGPVGPSWRELATKGSYKEAYEQAKPQFEAILASGSASDISALADLARYAGAPGQARRAYLALRQRHPGSALATRAAYTLGLMAFGGNRGAAIGWFETYLAEAPGGALAREALGRILEMQRTRAAAERYLSRFPHGPHAELAQSILDKDG